MIARFSFLLPATGAVITGPVQGNGGMVDAARLLKAQRIAAAGRPIGLYEPAPGCVAVFPDYSAAGNGEAIIVPIASLVGQVESRDEKIARLDRARERAEMEAAFPARRGRRSQVST